VAKIYTGAVVSNGFPHTAVFKIKENDPKTAGDKRGLFEICSHRAASWVYPNVNGINLRPALR
jgi:hypothetical protein